MIDGFKRVGLEQMNQSGIRDLGDYLIVDRDGLIKSADGDTLIGISGLMTYIVGRFFDQLFSLRKRGGVFLTLVQHAHIVKTREIVVGLKTNGILQ